MSEASKYLKQSFSDGPVQKCIPHTQLITFWGNFSNKEWKREKGSGWNCAHKEFCVCQGSAFAIYAKN